jgi:hypothetical protein
MEYTSEQCKEHKILPLGITQAGGNLTKYELHNKKDSLGLITGKFRSGSIYHDPNGWEMKTYEKLTFPRHGKRTLYPDKIRIMRVWRYSKMT